jgi:hypothetical protein
MTQDSLRREGVAIGRDTGVALGSDLTPDAAHAAAQAKGRERYDGFIEALGRRLARGLTLANEVSRDVDPTA